MGTFSWQTWNSGPFSIERKPGSKPGTVILCFHGPFTLRDAYSSLPTMSLKQVLELEPAPGEEPPVKNILDLTGCPYMDSSGLGIIVSHMVHCNKKGMKMIAAGVTWARDVPVPARFHVGERVRARNVNPMGHTRLPRYARGKLGVITRDHGVQVFNDSFVQGLGEKPQHVYSVRFAARELWGREAVATDSVYVDLWDDHLESA